MTEQTWTIAVSWVVMGMGVTYAAVTVATKILTDTVREKLWLMLASRALANADAAQIRRRSHQRYKDQSQARLPQQAAGEEAKLKEIIPVVPEEQPTRIYRA